METKLALQQKERSTALIAILTDEARAKEIEKGLTIQKIVDSALPISILKANVGNKAVSQALDVQLSKLVLHLNLKWNLSDFQVSQIVEDLLEKYPHESIEDFILVFKRARMGEFGELFRLDGAVIFGWMNIYLEEKYAVIENKLHSEKDTIYSPAEVIPSNVDWHKKWLDEITSFPTRAIIPMSEEEMELKGQERPVKPKYVTDAAYLNEHREKIFKFQEMTVRERHPEMNEEQIQEKLAELRAQVRYTTDVKKLTNQKK
jgi:hypothetical protein